MRHADSNHSARCADDGRCADNVGRRAIIGRCARGCADVAELKASLEALTKVKPAEDGVAALKTAIDNVKSNLEPAVASASEMLKPKVEQVKTAFAELQTAADGLTADNFRQKAPSIRAAMTQLRTATADLTSALTQSCPG